MSRVDADWNWRPAYQAREGARQGLRQAAERVLQDANRNVPVDTGALRASGAVLVDKSTAVVYYEAPYATIVHERLDVRHKVGRAKWLELAALEAGGRMAGQVASRIKL